MVFDLTVAAEMVFRRLQRTFMSASVDVRHHLFSEINLQCTYIVLPTCHGTKKNFIHKFVKARLYFFAKQQQRLRKANVSSGAHEMSSKSMQMRKSVSKIK